MPDPSGFLLIDKAAGCSSFDVVRGLRRISGLRKIGHTGTLDPFATGLLICALGPCTRLCKYLEAQDKTYSATLRLGSKTDTGDTEGRMIESGPVPAAVDGDLLLHKLIHLEELVPPRHSALKVNGQPAYAYARRGEDLELAPRPVKVHEFSFQGYAPPDLSYVCRVSKGTYIRSLSEYMARCLGTVGHTVSLRREAIGAVEVDEAQKLEDLGAENFQDHFFPARKLFSGHEFLVPDPGLLAALRNGQAVSAPGPDNPRVLLVDQDDRILGVARREEGALFPVVNLV